ncbi:MAG: hypothetical protein WC692_09000 [Erythrobacter sp.]
MTCSIRPFRDEDAEILPLVWREAIVRVGSRKRAFEIEIDGVPIHNWAMEKPL